LEKTNEENASSSLARTPLFSTSEGKRDDRKVWNYTLQLFSATAMLNVSLLAIDREEKISHQQQLNPSSSLPPPLLVSSSSFPHSPKPLIRPLSRVRIQARIRQRRPEVKLLIPPSPRLRIVDLLKDGSNGDVCVSEGGESRSV